jgi:hypothetical protein
MTSEQLHESERVTKEGGTPGVQYIYDIEVKQIRMAREGERGGTLAQAKELKKMAEEDEGANKESPFMQDGEGNWTLNPKAKIGSIELLALQSLRQSREKGDPSDPVTAITQAAEKWRGIRESLGVGGRSLPPWMTDLVAFTEAIKNISGGKGEDSAVKESLSMMQRTIDELKEDKWHMQFEAQQKQIQDLTGVLNRTLEAIQEVKSESARRTELDILHEIATEGIGLAKTELPGLRRDIKEALGSAVLPPGKTSEEREDRKKRFKQAINDDRDIEELGKRVFFPES